MRISKKVAEIWLKLFKKIEIYATILDNNVKYNYRKAVTQYMNRFELVVPCHFGLEAVVKREIYDLGYEITRVEDGRVSFEGDAEAICRANIFLRGAERVLLQVGRFKAATFDELFEAITLIQTKKIGRFPIVLVGTKYWSGLFDWVTEVMLNEEHNISPEDLNIFRIVDEAEEAVA